MNSLIIGAIDNYTWNDIKPWALSLKGSGYDGDVLALCYRVSPDVIAKLNDTGFIIICPEHDSFGNPIQHNAHNLPTQAHHLRTFHAWQYLMEDAEFYDVVMMCDTRDVIFQKNPQLFWQLLDLDKWGSPSQAWAPAEDILFDHEDWNRNMVQHMFGSYFYDAYFRGQSTVNSGTFFGSKQIMKTILGLLYTMTAASTTTGSDQGAFNLLTHIGYDIDLLPHDAGYACQCGTTLDPTKSHFIPHLLSPQPLIHSDGTVTTKDGRVYAILHQWDRVPILRQLIHDRYKTQ